ncbi:MAG: LamB/YcsF family protein [Gemmataceae bacterium]|nr:LamB/YcsF family protein [Gemmataceae bacterium]
MDIDLNADLGEGCGSDAELMPLLTSANISCGFHAGDPDTSARALALAFRHGVRVGAHPGYDDPEHFGRRELEPTEAQLFATLVFQIGGLAALAREQGLGVSYVKPHGALYNQACRDDRYARPVVEAAEHLRLPILALPGSRLESLAKGRSGFIAEGFADRRYLADGSLVPRGEPNAHIDDPQEAVAQAEQLIQERGVRSLCVHGDNPRALLFVQALRRALEERGHTLRAFA